MQNKIFILFFIVSIYFIINFLISKEIKRRQKEQEEKLESLFQTEEGRRVLEREFKKRNETYKKLKPFFMVVSVICALFLLFLGIMGIYFFIQDIKSGKQIMDIIFFKKGMYLISPIVVIFSIIKLIDLIRRLGENKV